MTSVGNAMIKHRCHFLLTCQATVTVFIQGYISVGVSPSPDIEELMLNLW